MTDKITVEFSRKEIKQDCKLNCPTSFYKKCRKTDKKLIECILAISVDYKIKEKKNGK